VSPTAIGLLGGLAAALCFGVGDFLVQPLTRERGWLPAVLGVQIVSVIALFVAAMVWHGPLELDQLDGLVLVLGTINTLGIIALYRAFEIGKLSLVSPIAGSMGAFTLVFAWVAGQSPAAIVLPGLAAVLLGIGMASLATQHEGETRAVGRALGVGWALLSAVGFGWVFFQLGTVANAIGSAWAIFGLRLVAIPWLLLTARAMRIPLRKPTDAADSPVPARSKPSRSLLVAVAILDSSGLIALSLGSVHGSVAIAAVLASAFPVVTILLARVRLHERLAWWQWIGVAAILLGVSWITIWRS
jgi:drug/metabolite transporter (DMT)-like permease